MKKIILLTASFLALSCSDDFTQNDNAQLVSQQQLNDLAQSNPEALLNISSGVLTGTNSFLNEFSTNGLASHDDYGLKSIDLGLDLMGNDVVQNVNHWHANYYRYIGRTEPSRITAMVWKFYFKVIFNVNGIIKLIPETTTDQRLRSVLGRSYALRGFSNFNLLRIYGDGVKGIPLAHHDPNEIISARAPYALIKDFILADLTKAYELLDATRDAKTDINKNVVAGLLARYHLEYGNNTLAAQYAIEARDGYQLTPSDAINLEDASWDGMCNIANNEWMWGADINTQTSTYYASFFSQAGSLNPGYAGLLGVYKSADKRLYNLIPLTDKRRLWFAPSGNSYGVPTYANLKFYDFTDFEGDYVFMRSAEMYLIEAEAKALSGDNVGARQALFDLVSTRDASYVLSTNSGQQLIDEVRLHRRIELWGEGFHFFDLKRWSVGVTRTYTGSNHPTYGKVDYPAGSQKFVFQIPLLEIDNNLDIGPADQNPL